MIYNDDPKYKALQHLGNAIGLIFERNRSGAGTGRRLGQAGQRAPAQGGGGARINIPGHPCRCYGQRRGG